MNVQPTKPSALLTWGASLLVAACIAMMGLTLGYFAWDVDSGARLGSAKMVDRVYHNWGQEVRDKILPQTYWDEAIVNLDNRFDPKWADNLIGNYLLKAQGLDVAMVADRDNRIIYDRAKRPIDRDSLRGLEGAIAPLLADIREGEARRPPIPAVQSNDYRLGPITATGTFRVGDRSFLLVASLVQPDRRARPLTDRSAVVIAGRELTPKTVEALGERFLFRDLRFVANDQAPTDGSERMILTNPERQHVGQLEWQPRAPGRNLLEQSLPVVIVFTLLIGGAVIGVSLRARRLTNSLVASEARASHLAFHDSLTGLPNRAKLDEAFEAMAANARGWGTPFAMLCIDLDRFKAVNDNLGHLAGDALIKVIAQRILAVCRPTDDVVRYGGDEFLILQAGASRAATDALAARLIRTIAEPVQINGDRVFVGASIGIVICDEDIESANECLRRADMALYEAKEAGRNCWRHFMPSMDRQLKDREALRARLHDALQAGSIALHYQPQVDDNGRIIGVEALSRWRADDRQSIPPASFVQVAEETGLIDSLGLYTLRQAFLDSRRWPGLKVAINVSAVQLRSSGFVDEVMDLVNETGVDPAQFEFEITERLLLAEDSRTLTTLRALRRHGFRIALDDFGTGYSSLGYLQRYPIDRVKIDRSFIVRLDRDRQAQSVVVAIVQLARAMELEVMAEGVETEAQRSCLRAAGCHEMQGFLTGRPMPAIEVAALLDRQMAS